MIRQSLLAFALLLMSTIFACSSAALLRNKAEMLTPQEEAALSAKAGRNLQTNKRMDRAFPDDICKNGLDDYGTCDESKFPTCPSGTQICYNRKAFKDRFHDDNRQPKFYIDYGLVFCYPENFDACSSCTPGRYCRSESRCILDENGYPCEQWL